MKKFHHASLKLHVIYSVFLSVIFLAILLFVRDIALGASMFFLVLYVVGNGIIHTKKNELKRDTLLEYVLVSAIVLVVLLGLLR